MSNLNPAQMLATASIKFCILVSSLIRVDLHMVRTRHLCIQQVTKRQVKTSFWLGTGVDFWSAIWKSS